MKEDGWVGLPLCLHDMRNSYETLFENSNNKNLLEDPDVDGRLMLRCVCVYIYIYIYIYIYRVSHELRSLLRESVP